MFKISDFIIATSIIKLVCKARKVPFIDLYVDFNNEESGLNDNIINIGITKNLGNTIFIIVNTYFNNFKLIHGIDAFDSDKQKENSLIAIANFIRQLTYSTKKMFSEDSPVLLRLYQYPFIWIVFKDIICPVYEVQLKNYPIFVCSSSQIDVSHYVEESDNENIEAPFIFLNSDIDYKPLQMASLLVSAIKCFELDPFYVIKDIVDSELRNKLIGLAKLEFSNDKQLNDFFAFLLTYVGLENKMEFILKNDIKVAVNMDKIIKTAQFGFGEDGITSSWWYLGLIEKMLGVSRGSDWSVYKSLHPFFKELWDRVEKERTKRGRDGLTYEALLRVKSKETDPKNVKVIEKMLATDRVW